MTDYVALAEELRRDEFARLSDAEIAAALNAEVATRAVAVDGRDLRDTLLRAGAYGRVVLLSRQVVRLDDPAAPLVEAAIVIIAAMGEAGLPADAAIWTAVSAAWDTLRGAGIVPKQTADAFLSRGEATVTRAQQLGFAEMTEHEIAAARKAEAEREARAAQIGARGR